MECYSDQITQSINRYPKLEDWLENFLFPSLRKVWDALKIGGYMALHMGDTYRFQVCDIMNHYIDESLRGSYYCGIIGIVGEKKRPTPVWVWRKMESKQNEYLYPYSFGIMYPMYIRDQQSRNH